MADIATDEITFPRLMTVREVAEALRCSRSQAYALVQNGDLPSARIAGNIRTNAAYLSAFTDAGPRPRELGRLGSILLSGKGAVGFVYFINGGTLTKVGYSRNPAHRRDLLQAGSGPALTVWAQFAGALRQEGAAQRMLAPWLHRAEWFELPGNVKRWLLAELKTFGATVHD